MGRNKKKKYPYIDTSKFSVRKDDYGRVMVKLVRRGNAREYPLFNSDGQLNGKLPETIKNALSVSAEDLRRQEENKEQLAEAKNK